MQSSFVLCLGRSAFLIVDSTFHVQWHAFGVRRQPPYSGKFAWLGNHPSLANPTCASVEVAKARCHYCSSKPGLLFGPFGPRSLQQVQFGTGSYQMSSSKLVLNGDCAVQKSEVAKL